MKQRNLTKRKFLVSISVYLFFVMFFPLKTLGVSVYVEPMISQYQIDDVFILEIKGNIQEECINAVRIELAFPTEVFEGMYFSEGGSLLKLWPKPVEIDNERGLISFVGGIPGGYCGSAYDKDVLFGRVALKVKEIRTVTERDIRILESSRVLLDDGEATPVEFAKIGGKFIISPERRDFPLNLWDEMVKKDRSAPDQFFPEIRQDEMLFEGKQALFFSATDKEAGIDYYELSEQRRFGFIPIERENWRRVESPVTLNDQQLRSIIKVKAVDRAGNERIETIYPKIGPEDILPWIFLLALSLIIYLKKKKAMIIK